MGGEPPEPPKPPIDLAGPPELAQADAPVIDRRQRLHLFASQARMLVRGMHKIATPTNLRKGLGRLRWGELRILAASMRNLLAYHSSLRAAQSGEELGGTETFAPEPYVPGLPLVSVVIPCVNHGAFVGEAVESALAQTFPSLEVIVVEGGSTDGTTPAIVAALAGPRVRVLMRQGGPYMAGDNRNAGIAEARGRYVCCLDADDRLAPTYVEKMLFLLEYRGFHIASSALRMFGTRNDVWVPPERPDLRQLMAGNGALSGAVYRRAVWRHLGGYRDTGRGAEHLPEDWDFWMRASAAGARIRNIVGETLFQYRSHAAHGSVSTAAGIRSLAEQGRGLLTRNRALITGQALRRSRMQTRRELRVLGETAMQTALAAATQSAPRRPTLLLAVPHMMIGGAETLLSEMVGGLAQAGWRTVVVATEFDPPGSGDAAPWFERHTPETYVFPRFLDPLDWYDFARMLIETRRPDVLLIAGSRFFYDLLPGLAAAYPAMARVDLLFNTIGHVAKHLEHRAYLTGAICENDETRNWLLTQAGWDEAKAIRIPSGVDTDRYRPRPRPAALAERLGIGPEDIVVGWSGRLSEEKAPEVFLELAMRCRDLTGVHFIMTGGGKEAGRIASLAAALPAGTRYQLMGIVDDIAEFYALYDIYVLTSSIDGRPFAVMESLASGCAVLASRIGGVPEMVSEGVTGYLVEPANAAAFEARLREMVADRRRLRDMRDAAARDAVEHFSARRMMDNYRKTLEAMMRDAAAQG